MSDLRRRAAMGLLALALIAGGSVGAPRTVTQAAFGDSAPLTTGSFTSASVVPVSGLTCTAGLVGLLSVRFDWTAQTQRYYRVVIINTGTNQTLVDTVASTNSYVRTTGFGAAADGATLRFDVYSQAPSATPGIWQSAVVSRTFRQAANGLTFTCL